MQRKIQYFVNVWEKKSNILLICEEKIQYFVNIWEKKPNISLICGRKKMVLAPVKSRVFGISVFPVSLYCKYKLEGRTWDEEPRLSSPRSSKQ